MEEALTQAQQEESQLPNALKTLQQERDIQARRALQMKKKLKPVEGSADEDIWEIEEANQICLRTISAIQTAESVNSSSTTRLVLFSKTSIILIQPIGLLLALKLYAWLQIHFTFCLADRTVIGI